MIGNLRSKGGTVSGKLILCLTILLVFAPIISIKGQTPDIIAAEYFWNTDPGEGNGTAITITSGPLINLSVNIPLNALTTGINRYYIRVKDSYGKWSLTYNCPVLVNASGPATGHNIVAVEYFWDTDPGEGSAIPITVTTPGEAIDLSAAISTSTLNPGIHTFYIRTRDDLNKWSHTYNCPVLINPATPATNPEIVAVEYFWDSDPGEGNGTPLTLTPGNVINLSAAISTSALSPGIHNFYIRTRDNLKKWSHTYSSPVLINPAAPATNPEIVAVEYFWDTDPGDGNGTPLTVTPGSAINLSAAISTSALSPGIHNFYIRTRDNLNKWSHTYSSPVLINPAVPATNPEIVAVEYFWDTDPGEGSGTPLSVTTPGTVIDLSAAISTSALNPGIHRFYIRTRDNLNKWSHTYSSPVYIAPDLSASNPQIIAAEYFWDMDPGQGNATPLTVTSGNVIDLSSAISTSALTPGIHRFYVRTRDDLSKWSHTYSSPVYIAPDLGASNPQIIAAEYFWDTDPGAGAGIQLTVASGGVVDLSQVIPTSSLNAGLHRYYVRAQDDAGQWSHTYSSPVYLSVDMAFLNPQVIAAEYYWDIDPGFDNATSIGVTPNGVVDLSQVIPASSLTPGLHRFSVRVKDDIGIWSHSYTSLAWIIDGSATLMQDIAGAEYFWDTDPGFGLGQPMTYSTVAPVIDETIPVALCGLSTGSHKLYIRVKDGRDNWSHCLISDVTVTNNGNPPQIVIHATNNGPVCEGLNIQFTLSGGAGAAVSWTGANGFSSNQVNPAVNNVVSSNAGRYYVTVDNGCSQATDSTDVSVIINEWTGLTDLLWSNGSNWTCGTPPNGANVLFSSSASNDLVLDQNRNIGNLDFNSSSKNVVLGNFDLSVQSITGAGSGSYVRTTGTGKLSKSVPDGGGFTFPVGNSGYNPVTISNNTGAADNFSVRVADEVYLNDTSGTVLPNPRVQRTWDISKLNSNAGAGVDLTFYWNSGETQGSPGQYSLYHYNSGAWEEQDVMNMTLNLGSAPYSLNYVGYNGSFSPFSIFDKQNTPLPVTLLSFSGNCHQGVPLLNWRTATESNNNYFTIEQSTDLEQWQLIHQVTGAGNSNTLHEYQLELPDYVPTKGNYFRLSQTDYDGTVSRLATIYLRDCGDYKTAIDIFPNPSGGLSMLTGALSGSDWYLINSIGQVIQQFRADEYGNVLMKFDAGAGLYTLRSQQQGIDINRKIVIY